MAAAPLPAPPPPTPTLEELPDELLVSILSRIPCRVDRSRMSAVCKAWCAVLARLEAPLPPPLPLPWLLLPTPFSDGSTRVACVLSACRVHHYLTITPPRARCFGSHDDAWLFLHIVQARRHQLLNARTGQTYDLPGELLRWNDPSVHNMVILAATLSSSPDELNCVAAAIVSTSRYPAAGDAALQPFHRCIALWRMGWPQAIEVPPDTNQEAYHADDIAYIDGAYRFLLTDSDNVLVCTLTVDQSGRLSTKWELIRFHSGERIYDNPHVHARYLIKSRGDLLLVVRFNHHPSQPSTSVFKVFLATERKMPDSGADADFPVVRYPFSWSELDTLGGRMLFVGHGCSRSYEVDQYPGYKDAIYFIHEEFKGETAMFDNGNLRQYPCSDNGKWSEGHVQHCFPRPNPSDHSTPAWLLP